MKLTMDPHKVPPQGLKDIFKDLRSVKSIADPRIAENSVLDFDIDPPAEFAERVHFLEKTFDCFHSQTPTYTPTLGNSLPPAKFFIADGIPGVTIFPGILPPLTQRVLLDRLLHRDLSNSKHRTNLHLHYDVSYPDHGNSFFTASPSDVLFKPKDAAVHKELDMRQVLQKKIRWMTLGGQYDWTNKVYPAEPPPEFPLDIANLIRALFDGTLDPHAAIVNIYSPGDTLSLHRDVSEEVDQPLVSISLGCECLFLIAVEDDTTEAGFRHASIRLRSGDALVMMNEARFAWHGVPKIFPDTCPSYLASWPNDAGQDGPFYKWDEWMTNKRINLNVRQMY